MKEGREQPQTMPEGQKVERVDFSAPTRKDYEKRVMLALTTADYKLTHPARGLEADENQERALEDLAGELRGIADEIDEERKILSRKIFERKSN